MSSGQLPTTVGVDLGYRDETTFTFVYPDGHVRHVPLERFELVVAEAVADIFDGLGSPMMDFYYGRDVGNGR